MAKPRTSRPDNEFDRLLQERAHHLGEIVKEQETRFEVRAKPKYYRVVAQRDTKQQAARTLEKIAGSKPARGVDLVGSEELKRKSQEVKKAFERSKKVGAKRRRG